jgi:hypothetical protein
MTFVVAIKCAGGLVLGADSRLLLDMYESGRFIVKDQVYKILTFKQPYNNIGVLVAGDLSLTSHFDWLNSSHKGGGYSIAAWIESFEKIELRAINSQITLSFDEFTNRLKEFLIQRWERSREERLNELARLKDARRRGGNMPPSNRFSDVPFVIVTIAGLNETNMCAHVFPFILTDQDCAFDGQNYLGRHRNIDPIPTPCGIFTVGEQEFTKKALESDDFLSEFLRNPEQPLMAGYENKEDSPARAERLKQAISKIQDFKERFNIHDGGFPGAYVCDGVSIKDAERLAHCLIYGTTWYSRGLVAGWIRICTIKPVRGIECKWIEQISPQLWTGHKPNF